MAITETKCPLTGDRVVTATGRDKMALRGALAEVGQRDAEAKRTDARENPGALLKDATGKVAQVNGRRAAEMAGKGWDLARGATPCVTMPDNFDPDPKEVEAARAASRRRRGS